MRNGFAVQVDATAHVAPILDGAGFQQPVAHFELVQRRQVPIVVATDAESHCPLCQFATGFGHRLSIGEAVDEAQGARDILVVAIIPLRVVMLAFGFGREDDGIEHAGKHEKSADETAAKDGAWYQIICTIQNHFVHHVKISGP